MSGEKGFNPDVLKKFEPDQQEAQKRMQETEYDGSVKPVDARDAFADVIKEVDETPTPEKKNS